MQTSCQRIISLSPSTTEILFALGLGDRVVGVTRYCTYPPEARKKATVGGYLDPNYEAIVMLKPDVVILLPEHQNAAAFLDELGIQHFTIDNKAIADILSAIRLVGETCGAREKAQKLLADIDRMMNSIQEQTKSLPRPRVMICIGRPLNTGALEEVYIAGRGTSYDELIVAAGGSNAFSDKKPAYPMLSAEGIINVNPDIIIDLIADMEQKGLTESVALKEWQSVAGVNAVKNNRLYALSQSYSFVPGPRFIYLLRDLAHIIHPEIEWND
ncbi:ABC transporter substrate-binding protein [candidate division KSB1 bacterium]|nr:ABC transporter substrate-binding protein [candidate division KSB1 bacterium]